MNWKEYFEEKTGKGFLATANKRGETDIAIYAPPHAMEDGTLAFGMEERLTHSNLQENPHAVYAFNEDGYDGVRIYLEKAWEEKTGPTLEEIRKSVNDSPCPIKGDAITHVVYFRIKDTLPLVRT